MNKALVNDCSSPAASGPRLQASAFFWLFLLVLVLAIFGLPDPAGAAEMGAIKWSEDLVGAVHSSPAIDANGTIYAGSNGDNLYALSPAGTVKWSANLGGAVRSSPAIDANGTIYVGSNDDNLYALSPAGTVKWSANLGGAVRSSPAIDANGTIYAGSILNNRLYALSPAGTVKWSMDLGGWVDSSPAIGGNGAIYVGSMNNNLYALSSAGTVKWSKDLGGAEVYSSPAIDANGTIYVGSNGDNLYAVQGYRAGGLMANASWPKFHQNLKNLGRRSLPVVEVLDSADCVVTTAAAEAVNATRMREIYGLEQAPYSSKITYSAELAPSKQGALVDFSFKVDGVNRTTGGLALYKLLDASPSFRTFGDYRESGVCETDGDWWVAEELHGPALASSAQLAPDTTYRICFCIRDNGKNDLDSDLGEILDPLVLTGASSESLGGAGNPGNLKDSSTGGGGCTLNPAADFSVELLLLLACAPLLWLRLRSRL